MKKFFLTLGAAMLSFSAMMAQDVLYMAFGSSSMADPVAATTDPSLSKVSDNIYEGTIELKRSAPFVFYTGDAAGSMETRYSTGTSNNTMISWLDTVDGIWPGDAESEIKKAVLSTGTTYRTFVNTWPSNVEGVVGTNTSYPVKFHVDLSSMTYDIKIVLEEQEAPEAFYVWGHNQGEGASLSAYKNVGTLTPTEVGGTTYTGTINIDEITGNNFQFVLNTNGDSFTTSSIQTSYGGRTQTENGGSNPVNKNIFDFSEEDSPIELPVVLMGASLADGSPKEFECANGGDLKLTFDFDAMTLTGEMDIEKTYTVTLNYTSDQALEYDAYNYVQTYTLTGEDMDELNAMLVEDNVTTYEMSAENNALIFEPVMEGVTITVTNSDDIDTDQLMSQYGVMINNDLSNQGNYAEGSWAIMFMAPEQADGLSFDINVTYTEQTNTSVDVTVEIEGVDLPAGMNAWDLVALRMGDDDVDVVGSTFSVNGDVPLELFFSCTDSDYMISNVAADNEEAANILYNAAENGFDVTVLENCTLLVTVEPNFTFPQAEPVNVTLNYIKFEGADVEGDACAYVTTTGEALTGEFPADFNVDTDTYTFTCTPAVALNFEPREGYQISEITSSCTDSDVVVIASAVEEGTWSVSILAGAPEEISFNIVVIDSVTAGVSLIGAENGTDAIYNLQGVRVDANKLVPGLYIVNGKKVVIK